MFESAVASDEAADVAAKAAAASEGVTRITVTMETMFSEIGGIYGNGLLFGSISRLTLD